MAMSTKILEFGFCEGWTSVCVWMREAQFDLGLDWLPACTTLTAPALVRGLLPMMREVTRRIMNRPAVSKAAVSERLMAAEVAEGLEVSTVEAFAPVARMMGSFVASLGLDTESPRRRSSKRLKRSRRSTVS